MGFSHFWGGSLTGQRQKTQVKLKSRFLTILLRLQKGVRLYGGKSRVWN